MHRLGMVMGRGSGEVADNLFRRIIAAVRIHVQRIPSPVAFYIMLSDPKYFDHIHLTRVLDKHIPRTHRLLCHVNDYALHD